MTTIVYDHKRKQIATDGRETTNEIILSDTVDKSIKVGDATFFLAGDSGDIEIFCDEFEKGKLYQTELNAGGYMIKDGKAYNVYVNEVFVFCQIELKSSEAFGSGGEFAIAALDFGCSAKEAVKYAMSRDFKSGGKIRVYNL